jgi:hypothetical protein
MIRRIEMITTSNLGKSEAIYIVNSKLRQNLTSTNTIYSNINSSKSVWWFDPNNKKFLDDLYLLLNNENRKLHVFYIPSNSINEPDKVFRQRGDKGASHIEIWTTDLNYSDCLLKKISFIKFKIADIDLLNL